MNYFYFDHDLTLNAQWLCDQHLRKMIVETAQILSTAMHKINNMKNTWPNPVYKPTHVNHPVNVWARKNVYNYGLLFSQLEHYLIEYNFRFNKEHKTAILFNDILDDVQLVYLAKEGKVKIDTTGPVPSDPPNCTPVSFNRPDGSIRDITEVYRIYYNQKLLEWLSRPGKKRITPKWTHRPIPEWLISVKEKM